MQGPMQEAQAGFADLKDVKEPIFIRFCENAYRGDYTPADQEIILDSSTIKGVPTLPKDSATADEETPPEMLHPRMSKKKGQEDQLALRVMQPHTGRSV